MTRDGYSPVYRAPAGAMTWRGLSMGMTATQTIGAAAADAIAWDVVFAETDGIRSTGTHGPYALGAGTTVPTGAAGVVPSGMAGLWRLTATLDVYPSDGGLFFAFGIVINDFDKFWENDLAGLGDWLAPSDFNLPITSFVYPLEEGDVVWCEFSNTDAGSSDVGGPDATFLMEYLGATPEEPS